MHGTSCYPIWDVSASGPSCTRLADFCHLGSKSAGTSSCNPALDGPTPFPPRASASGRRGGERGGVCGGQAVIHPVPWTPNQWLNGEPLVLGDVCTESHLTVVSQSTRCRAVTPQCLCVLFSTVFFCSQKAILPCRHHTAKHTSFTYNRYPSAALSREDFRWLPKHFLAACLKHWVCFRSMVW